MVAKPKKLVANFFFGNNNNKKSYIKNVLYTNGKLQGLLALGIYQNVFSLMNSKHHLIKNKQKRTLPNFYSKFIYHSLDLFCFPSQTIQFDDHGCPLNSKTGIYNLRVHCKISHIYVCQEVSLKS